VYGLIHDPHAAVADAPTDLVRADVLRQLLTVGETCRHCHSDLIPSNTAWCSLSAGIPRTRAVMPDCPGAVTAQARRHSFSVTPDCRRGTTAVSHASRIAYSRKRCVRAASPVRWS